MQTPAVGSTPLLGAASGTASLNQTFDSFLLLLTTQLQNQDPLDPMDSDKFTSQLVQFTGVEQSIATNSNLEQLIAMFRANEFSGAVQYIGKSIEAHGATTALANGNAEWSYAIPGQTSETTLKVLNDRGLAVYSTTGKIGTGSHGFVWDGKDSAGNPAPDGDYTLIVRAIDPNGDDVDVSINLIGRVTGVQSEAGETQLTIGGVAVALKDILSVKEAPSGT
jgi:flagellar basal-body rod modification protein FlgD